MLEDSKTLRQALNEYRKDNDFTVREIDIRAWGMSGWIISWEKNDRALYALHIKQIMALGGFDEFMVSRGRTGRTEVWFYNRKD